MPFKIRLLDYFEGEQAKISMELLYQYESSFTGRFFDSLARESPPNEITANDLLAVTMLSVQVPPEAAIELLTTLNAEVTERLAAIPLTSQIWDEGLDLSPEGDAWELWRLVRRHGMGRTITSKMLAAKRPNLMPLHDTVVEAALYPDHVGNFDHAHVEPARPAH